jgi:hypothetical protein
MAAWLRWRGRGGTEAVTTGFLAGATPLVLGNGALGWERTTCLAAAALAGVIVALRLGTRPGLAGAVSALAISTLVGCMGCPSLGALEVAAVLAGALPGLLAVAGANALRDQ